MIEWVEDQDKVITNEAFDRQFGPTGAEPDEDLVLTESKSFDIVREEAPSGLEALRRLVRLWDPLSGGKRFAHMRQILLSARCRLQDLRAGFEKWEELVRRYERSKSSGTTTPALDVDIKTAALEALVPSELERHLAMNHARLITHGEVRSEIQAYMKARRSRFAFKTVVTRTTSDPLEVDSFGKGGSKGKNEKSAGKRVKKEGQYQNQDSNPSKEVVCFEKR